MNYKKRFNKIVERIGEREEIEGIDRIYDGGNGYFSIKFNGLEITRGTTENLSQIDFSQGDWDKIEELPALIEDWFTDLEKRLNEEENKIVTLNGKKYKRIEED